jgi:hypothetical protein
MTLPHQRQGSDNVTIEGGFGDDESRQLTIVVQRDLDGRHSVIYAGVVVDFDTPEGLAKHAGLAVLDHLTRVMPYAPRVVEPTDLTAG